MYLPRILKFTITSILVAIHLVSFAQEQKPNPKPRVEEEEEMLPRTPFLRFGIDPFSVVKSYIYPATVSGLTAQLDMEIKGDYFPVVELGNENFSMKHSDYKLRANGLFLRLGVDNNFVKYLGPEDRDIFFAGLRYCLGSGLTEATDIVLPSALSENSFDMPSETYFVQWGELVAGVKTELFANIFLGWTARIKRRISLNDLDLVPYYIPGYGKQEKNVNVEMSVQILYAIPYKKKK